MAGSRRKSKKSRPKVRVGLPKKHPNIFKPAFTLPAKLRSLISDKEWDEKASVLSNYKSLGVVSNPNLLSVRSRTPHIIETDSLQVPRSTQPDSSVLDDPGSDLEEDDLKSALGKKRKDGKNAPLQPLTTMQRVYIGRLVKKYGDDYQAMFMDTKLNAMQHSIANLEKLCKRYHLGRNERVGRDSLPWESIMSTMCEISCYCRGHGCISGRDLPADTQSMLDDL